MSNRTNPPVMHGVGLLRVSQTPVTVDSEQYVVFVNGWLAPRVFASWIEAMNYFKERLAARSKAKQRRLRVGIIPKPGRRPGANLYKEIFDV